MLSLVAPPWDAAENEGAIVAERTGGTPIWKIVLGVFVALALTGGCIAGGCILLVGSAAVGVAKKQEQQKAYIDSVSAKVDEADITGSYITIHGTITNDGDKTVRYWKVVVDFLDGAGNVVDTSMTNSLNRLRPGASEKFRVMSRSSAQRTNVRVEEVSLE